LPQFRAWLYRIIVNLVNDYYRVGRRGGLSDVEPRIFDPVVVAERRSSNSTLSRALRALTLREEELVYLRFVEELPHYVDAPL